MSETPYLDAIIDSYEHNQLLQAVVDALVARPFRGTKNQRRQRMYGSDWEAVHDALDALEKFNKKTK